MHAPDQPVATDTDGNLNNYMDIKEFRLETKSILGTTKNYLSIIYYFCCYYL